MNSFRWLLEFLGCQPRLGDSLGGSGWLDGSGWLGSRVRVSGLPLNKQRAKPSVAEAEKETEAETETGAGTAIEMSQTNRLNKYFSNKHHNNKIQSTEQKKSTKRNRHLLSLKSLR